VHHGGTGTTAAGLRAGVPTVILSTWLDQIVWGAQIERLKVGATRAFTSTTEESLVEDLRTALAADYVARARDFATRMTRPAESAAAAADHVEKFARSGLVG
jgi:UDP:flavonoid glycosyltransferase YjiC (YdhE family)